MLIPWSLPSPMCLDYSTGPAGPEPARSKPISRTIGLFQRIATSNGFRTPISAPNACLVPQRHCAARAGMPPSNQSPCSWFVRQTSLSTNYLQSEKPNNIIVVRSCRRIESFQA